METGDSDWDEHVALACFRSNTELRGATGMTPFKAVFAVEDFQAWSEVDASYFDDKPDSLPNRLALLHRQLYSRGRDS